MPHSANDQARSALAARGDRLAVTLSLVCIAHCIALPALAIILPFAAVAAEAEWVHWLFAIGAVFASGSVAWTSPDARTPAFLIPAGMGCILVFGALFAEGLGVDEAVPTVLGGVLLSAAHLRRLLTRRAP